MNKEQLQSIVDNAPNGTTNFSGNGVHYRHSQETPYAIEVYWSKGEEWIESELDHLTRSLSDIKTILSQQTKIERLEKARDEQSKQLSDRESRMSGYLRDIESAQAEIEQLKAQVNMLVEKLGKSHTEIDRFNHIQDSITKSNNRERG